MPIKSTAANIVRTLPPPKAIEILTILVKDAAALEREAFGSPRRDQWTITARGALERAFGPDSSIVTSFQTAQSIVFKRGDSAESLRRVDNQKLESELSVIQSAIQQLTWEIESRAVTTDLQEANLAPTTIMVFVSHSSRDELLAKALIDLLKSALALPSNLIRCSSVDGYRLPVGVNTESKLREEVNEAKALIGLITPSSLASYFVMFELGARWGADQFMAPLLAGVEPGQLKEPLRLLNVLSADNRKQLFQLVGDVANQLNVRPQNSASYSDEVDAVVRMARGIPKSEPVQAASDEAAIAALKQENSSLSADNALLLEKLKIKRTIQRIHGHTYVNGDDAEMCANCLAVRFLAVPLQDMNLDGKGRKATCPNCKMPRGNGPPIPRHQAEQTARRIAEKTQ